ncbi:hypothetical protein ABFG93_09145 [Pseudalkalibacillus hwajinpoensis]|uniref:hypothetical protein n=1 Tax=Guptibacillus hwajinpoensis TaxID=208199 RepID=UPI00325C171C
MDRFDELIQQQLKLADQLIHTREEIQQLEVLDYSEARKSMLIERKNDLSRMENDFESLISAVITCFEKTPI